MDDELEEALVLVLEILEVPPAEELIDELAELEDALEDGSVDDELDEPLLLMLELLGLVLGLPVADEVIDELVELEDELCDEVDDEVVELEVADVELLLALIVSEYIIIALTPPQASLGVPLQATAAAFDVSEGFSRVLPQIPTKS